jgi:hypothetical protein
VTLVPLIKETRKDKIVGSLNCIDQFPQDRNNQRECILKLFPGRSEKSAFRGMIIPSLRQLGLILGHGSEIELSANGSLLLESAKIDNKTFSRVFRAILLEIDHETFRTFKQYQKNEFSNSKSSSEEILNNIESISIKQSKERLNHWNKLLFESNLLIKNKNDFMVNENNLNETVRDLKIDNKVNYFLNTFFSEYRAIITDELGIVRISKLRQRVSRLILKDFNQILTERQFDNILAIIPHVTDDYILSFGEPMGSEEKLFKYRDRYFKTVSVTFFGVD